MTFKERLKKEHPAMISADVAGGCYGCPSDYGYKTEQPAICDSASPDGYDFTELDALCTKCWNMES